MSPFTRTLHQHLGQPLQAAAPAVVQVNLGLRCNLSCRHCHVAGGPGRSEVMSWATMRAVLRLVAALPDCQVDITGGAPELNPEFRRFVSAVREQGHPVQVRSNLTVLLEPGMEDLPGFLADRQVQLVASLPCYLDSNVDAQRGSGVFRRSVEAIRRLNALGYGRRSERPLNLVYNPGGPSLPPGQAGLEEAYRQQLREQHGIVFSRLLTMTNMPIGRFLEDLQRRDQEADYWRLLEEAFNPQTVADLMCRHQICVAWDGSLSDCDFNQALGFGLAEGLPRRVDDLDPALLTGRPLVTGRHCFGCTAGCGSSCGGALVA